MVTSAVGKVMRVGRLKKGLISAVVLAVATLLATALALLASSPAFAESETVADTDQRQTQYGDWFFAADAPASGGWESTTRTQGATATLKFRGPSVTWKTITYEGGGVTDVFLDGKKVASFDGYSDPGATIYNVTGYSKKRLSDRKHTLTLVATGTRGPGRLPGDAFTTLDRFIVNGKTIEENSHKIAYDGWVGKANRKASGGSYRESTSQTLTARCGLFGVSSANPEISLITAKGPTRGQVKIEAYDITSASVTKEQTVNLHSSTVEWQHIVPITGLTANRTYILRVSSADGTPVVFDGCIGDVWGPLN